MNSAARHKNIVLALILVSYLMIVLDISITITGIPMIRSEFGFSPTTLSWVQNAYTLVFGGLLLLGARLGDIYGRRRMFMVGIVIFVLASLGVGAAQTELWMIMSRALQGLGAAILAPSTLALLSTNFVGHDRTRAIAYYGAVAGIGASIGLVLGGLFAGLLSWRLGLLMNLPIGMVMLLLIPRFIKESDKHSGTFDLLGAALSVVGMSAIVLSIIQAASFGWLHPSAWLSFLIGAMLIAFFVRYERAATDPILPLRIFNDRERVGAYITRFFFLGGMLSFWFFLTQYLQDVKGFSATVTGFIFLATTIPNFVIAVLVPNLTRRFGSARLLMTGLLIAVIGMFWLGRISPDSPFWLHLIVPMALIGLGQGACLAPLTAAGVVRVSPRDAGVASGMVNVAHQIGGSFGLSILVAVFTIANTDGLTGADALAHRISVALSAGGVLLLIAFVVSYIMIIRNQAKERY